MIIHKQNHEFPWWVEVDNNLEWIYHHDIIDWGVKIWGFDNWCKNWKSALSGSPSRSHYLFSTYVFKNYDDALLFAITWCGNVTVTTQSD